MIIYQIHPLHGYHFAYSPLEADSNNKRGWRTVTKEEFFNRPKKPDAGITSPENDQKAAHDREMLSQRYEEKFGKKPHGRMKTESIRSELGDE